MTTAIISNYLENKIINHVLRNTAYTSPGTNVYLALYTDATAQDDADNGTEVTSGSYERVQVTAWDAPTSGCTANTNAITFNTATGAWGNIRYVGIRDASTSGSLLMWGQLTADKSIGVGDTFSIAAGDLDIKLYGAYSFLASGSLLNHILRNTSFTTPGTSVYAALYTTTPDAADSGGVEVTGGSYARVQIAGTSDWDVPNNGSTANTNIETYFTATAGWGNVAGVGLRTAATGGELLFYGTLTGSKAVASGDTFRFPAGALTVTVS